MKLSHYLQELVDRSVLEQDAAEVFNLVCLEAEQADLAKEYLEGKKRLLADLQKDFSLRRRMAMSIDLKPYIPYFEKSEFVKSFQNLLDGLPSLLKKVESPCIFCREPFENHENHVPCVFVWMGVHLESMLRDREAAGKATPEDIQNRIALNKELEEVNQRLKAAESRIPATSAPDAPEIEGSFDAAPNGGQN